MSEYEHYERDEEPLTEEEEAYGRAYAETLAVGAPMPSTAGLDLERARRIRQELDQAWRAKVRRITGQRRVTRKG